MKPPIGLFFIEPIAEKVAIITINHKYFFFLVLLATSWETGVP